MTNAELVEIYNVGNGVSHEEGLRAVFAAGAASANSTPGEAVPVAEAASEEVTE